MPASPSPGAAQPVGTHDGENSYCLSDTCYLEGPVGKSSVCHLINSRDNPPGVCHRFYLTNEETEAPMG